MEMSLNGSFETLVNERSVEEQFDQTLKKINEEFYDAYGDDELKTPKELELSKTQQKKWEQKLHQV